MFSPHGEANIRDKMCDVEELQISIRCSYASLNTIFVLCNFLVITCPFVCAYVRFAIRICFTTVLNIYSHVSVLNVLFCVFVLGVMVLVLLIHLWINKCYVNYLLFFFFSQIMTSNRKSYMFKPASGKELLVPMHSLDAYYV